MLPVVINGNINEIDDVRQHLQHVDGVMLGRLACQNPYAIAEIHHALYPDSPLLHRAAILDQYVNYVESLSANKVPMSLLLKPIFNMAHGLPGAKRWKAQLMAVQQTGGCEALAASVLLLESRFP